MMRLVLFGVVVSAFLLFNLGISFLREKGRARKQIVVVHSEIKTIKEKIDSIQQLEDYNADELAEFYIEFFNNMKLVSSFHNAEAVVEAQHYRDRENIEQSFTQAQYCGIRKVDVQVTFRLHDLGTYPLLLNTMSNIERSLPIQITKVTHKDNLWEFQVTLYGI